MFSRADVYVPQCVPGAQSLRRPLLVWAAAAGLALMFVGLIVSAPLLLAHNHEGLAQAIYQSFSRVCHQIPERSFQIAGHSFAVCARCTGLYVGLAAGILLFPLVHSLRRTLPAPARLWLLLAAAPTALDFSLGFFGLWQNTHLSRFVTATLLGAVSAFYIMPGLVDLSRTNFRRFFGRDAARRQPAPEQASIAAEHSAPSDYSWPSNRI